MKRQQTLTIEIDEAQLRNLCERLPLEETDRQIAFALASLCAGTGSYTPARGVGQKEIAKSAGIGVRTLKRRLVYLVRYGILTVNRSSGRSNCYQFDLAMLIDAPPITHDLYGYIKTRERSVPEATKHQASDRQRLLFADLADEETTAPEQQEGNFVTRMTGAAVQFTKRLFTFRTEQDRGQTSDTATQTGAIVSDSDCQPGPNRGHGDQNRGQTGAITGASEAEPGPSAGFGAENTREPGPNRGHLPLNRGQTGAKPGPSPPTVHTVQNTDTDSETLIKNYSLQSVHVDLDSDSSARGAPPDAWSLPPRTTKPRNSELPLGERKIYWTRDVEDSELTDPAALQELYLVAVDQGFFLESEVYRKEFFALAHYVSRQKNIRKKIGLFSSLVDRTYDNKLPFGWENNITADDELWAVQTIKKYDSPAHERTQI